VQCQQTHLIKFSCSHLSYTRPFVVGGATAPILPITIRFKDPAEAERIHLLLGALFDSFQDASAEEITQALQISSEFRKAVDILDSNHDVFFCVLLGKRIGIYLEW
jgi:hypothetical protein